MTKLVYQKLNKDIAKKVLSKGATLKTAGEIVGNEKSLSQTKAKKDIGLDNFNFSGRRGKSSKKIYYSETELLNNQLIYPISEMSDFNNRLSEELHYFHVFGYIIQDINYVPGKRIADVTFVIQDPKDSTIKNELHTHSISKFNIKFLDLDQVPYIDFEVEKNANLFILPTENDDDLENIAISDEQTKLLNLEHDNYSVVIATKIDNDEYYQTNINESLPIFKNHSFIKRNGSYFNSLMFEELNNENSEYYDMIQDCYDVQMANNGFAIQDGRIVALDAKYDFCSLDDFHDYLLNLFSKDYVIANRYFNNRYSNNMNEDTTMTDAILDSISTNVKNKSKEAFSTFAELELSTFDEYSEDAEKNESTETTEGEVPDEYADLFKNKVQTTSSETETDDKHLPTGTDVDIDKSVIDAQIMNGESNKVTSESAIPESESSEVTYENIIPESESNETTSEDTIPESESSEVTSESTISESESNETTHESAIPESEDSLGSVRKVNVPNNSKYINI